MNRVSINLPYGLHVQLKRVAKREGVSIDQFVTYAIARQLEQSDLPARQAEREQRSVTHALDPESAEELAEELAEERARQ